MIGRIVSHYRILEELGGGGMGVVYKAEDTRLGRQVALKFLSEELSRDSDAVQRFQREARAASSLNHPNICTIYEFDEHEGQQFIVMELMEGQTLKERIEGQPLPTEEIVSLAAQIAEGLAAAHERGIIHRDIKPGNLFVGQRGQLKVLDFGVAKLLPREDDATLTGTQTVGGQALGTLAYMAPEQWNREKVDARTDIYALGCVLYEMATGQRPFAQELGAQRITSILTRMPEPPSRLNPEVPAWLDAVILKCLEKEPGRRYQSAKELQVDLRRVGSPSAPAPALSPQAPAWGRIGSRWQVPPGSARRAVIGLAGIAALVAVLLGLDVGGWRTQLLGGAGPPKIDSIAVLPLKNLMGDPEQDYFVDGMHEALTAELSKISALKVISRTSTMQYKGVTKSLPQVARELGVAGVIEGSVLREGDQVRITVQLIHGPSDRHLWAESFDRELRGILALHSDVARAIAAEVRVQLTPQEQVRLRSARPVNPAAYEQYALGRHHWNQRTTHGYKQAIEYFRRALEQDPSYAPAYAALADVYMLLGEQGGLSQKESRSLAEAAIRKALELDRSAVEAQASLGWWKLQYEWNWAEAEQAFKRAIELNPGDSASHGRYGRFLGFLGRFEEALVELQRARELDPLSIPANAYLGQVYLYARQYDLAAEHMRRTLQLNPNHPLILHNLGELYIAQGSFAEAIPWLESSVRISGQLSGSPSSHYLAMLGCAHARAKRRQDAVKILNELNRRSQQGLVSAFDIASLYTALGETERALDWLEQGYEQRDLWLVELKAWPWFDSLQEEPRFQDLLRRMNFPET